MSEEKQMVDLKVQDAKAVIILGQADYEYAVEMLRGIKEYRKKLDARYRPIQQKTKEANQLALQHIRDYEVPLNEAVRIINSSMSKYVTKKEADRQAEQDRIRRETEAKEREAIKRDLEECGLDKKEAAEESERMEVYTPEVEIEDTTKTEKTDKISYRETWKFEIEDVSIIPAEYMIPDEKKIGAVVRALKNNINIAGVRIYVEKSVINRY